MVVSKNKNDIRVPRKPVPSQTRQKMNTLGRCLQMATVKSKLGAINSTRLETERVSTPVSPPLSPFAQGFQSTKLKEPVTPRISPEPTSPPSLETQSCKGLGLTIHNAETVPLQKKSTKHSLTPQLEIKKTSVPYLDTTLIKLNTARLQSDHPLNGVCLQKIHTSTRSSTPVFSDTENTSVTAQKTLADSNFVPNTGVSSVYEDFSDDDTNFDQDRTPNVEALKVYSYVHYNNPNSAELMLQIKCQENTSQSDSNWRYIRSSSEASKAKELAKTAIWGLKLANTSFVNDMLSQDLRLHGEFKILNDQGNVSKVQAFLFQSYLIVHFVTVDGFEKLHSYYNLEDDDLTIYADQKFLVVKRKTAEARYLAMSKSQLAKWITAINDPKSCFPLTDTLQPDKLNMSGNLGLVDCGSVEQVLCIPIGYLNTLPFVLSQLGPQDKLGLVVVTSDGSTAFLELHKPSWPHWKEIIRQEFQFFELFTPACQSVIDTAYELFGSPISRPGLLSRSVIVVSGCPLTKTESIPSIVTHAIGIGNYDLTMMTRLVEESDGRFYHAESDSDLLSCMVGLSASERTVMHSNVEVTLDPSPNCKITQILGQKLNTRNCESVRKIPIGRMLAGQTRTVLLQLSIAEQQSEVPMLNQCDISSRSAINGTLFTQKCIAIPNCGPKEINPIPLPLFFDRILKITSEILKDCRYLATNKNWSSLRTLLDRATTSIYQSAMNPPTFNQVNHLFDNWDAELIKVKPRYLAQGLKELKQKISSNIEIDSNGLAILYEASQILETQYSVTGRSCLDRLFFEELNMNRL